MKTPKVEHPKQYELTTATRGRFEMVYNADTKLFAIIDNAYNPKHETVGITEKEMQFIAGSYDRNVKGNPLT